MPLTDPELDLLCEMLDEDPADEAFLQVGEELVRRSRWGEAEEIGKHPAVGKAIPIVLGDNYRGFGIVGTTPDYVTHYGAPLSQGRLWHEPLEAVLGADVASRLRPPVGATFVSAHGPVSNGGVAVSRDANST